MLNILRPTSIGSIALQRFQAITEWRIFSTFMRSFILASGGHGLIAVGSSLQRGPINLILNCGNEIIRSLASRRNSPFQLVEGKVIGESSEIPLENVDVWSTPMLPPLSGTAIFERNLLIAEVLTFRLGRDKGLGRILPFFSDGVEENRPTIKVQLGHLSLRALPAIGKLINGVSNRDLTEIDHAVQSLSGLGVGLTPSGDDFLCGFLVGFRSISQALSVHDVFLEELGQRFLENVKSRTTWLAEDLIFCASYGEYSEGIYEFLKSLTMRNKTGLLTSILKLINTGGSSGVDTTSGLLLGAKLALVLARR